MKVLLLDAKEFAKVEGKVFHYTNYHSFNMKNQVGKLWSNGWCSVSQFKVDAQGNVYGRIANELIKSGYYKNRCGAGQRARAASPQCKGNCRCFTLLYTTRILQLFHHGEIAGGGDIGRLSALSDIYQ